MAFQMLKVINVKRVFNTGLVYLKIIRISCGLFSGTWKFNFFYINVNIKNHWNSAHAWEIISLKLCLVLFSCEIFTSKTFSF